MINQRKAINHGGHGEHGEPEEMGFAAMGGFLPNSQKSFSCVRGPLPSAGECIQVKKSLVSPCFPCPPWFKKAFSG